MSDLNQQHCDDLADIIWFIKGRQSACQDRGANSELDARHIEALRLFRIDFMERASRPSVAINAGDIRIFRDGNQWCAVRGDFRNLQESPAGIADSPAAAITALYAAEPT